MGTVKEGSTETGASTMTDDLHGTLNPEYDANRPRFAVTVRGHEPDEESGWQFKLDVIDFMYLDSDGYPIYSIAAGDSWGEAFATAGRFVKEALESDCCVF